MGRDNLRHFHLDPSSRIILNKRRSPIFRITPSLRRLVGPVSMDGFKSVDRRSTGGQTSPTSTSFCIKIIPEPGVTGQLSVPLFSNLYYFYISTPPSLSPPVQTVHSVPSTTCIPLVVLKYNKNI